MKKIILAFLMLTFLVTNKSLFAQCSSGDCQNGYGVYLSEYGRYEGYFAGGLYNGQGSFYWTNGDKYVGEWLKGWRTGYGIYYWTNGDQYEGYFKENKITGFGTRNYAFGTRYEGNWLDGKYNGYGVVTAGPDRFINNCKDCKTYKGNWVTDLKSGFGRCYDKNGYLIYEGEFWDDKPVSTYPNRF